MQTTDKLSLEGKGRCHRGGDVDEARVTVYTWTQTANTPLKKEHE